MSIIRGFAVFLLIAGFFCCAVAACKRGSAQPAAADTRGAPDAVYTVRGQVETIPETGKPTTEFQVHHEAIPDFLSFDGKMVGMASMTMSFTLAQGVTLDGIKPGDVVEMTLAQWCKPKKIGLEIRKLVKLPSDTPLNFKPAK